MKVKRQRNESMYTTLPRALRKNSSQEWLSFSYYVATHFLDGPRVQNNTSEGLEMST